MDCGSAAVLVRLGPGQPGKSTSKLCLCRCERRALVVKAARTITYNIA